MSLRDDNGLMVRAGRAVLHTVEQEACIHTHAVNIARMRQLSERRPGCNVALP
jgi:hypothetical protein